MYAIVKVGGKQYRVEKGDSIVVDRMPADEGAKVTLEPLLFRSDKTLFEASELAKVKVEAVVTGHERGRKVHVLKFKPKKGYKRRSGHRSDLTRLEIKDIKATGAAGGRAKAETGGSKAKAETGSKAKAAGAGKKATGPATASKGGAAAKRSSSSRSSASKRKDDDGS